MAKLTLFDNGVHRNVLIEVGGEGTAVQTNQHLIVHGKEAMLLDPGGNLVFAAVHEAVQAELRGAHLTRIFLSHQDPDVVSSTSAWLMNTDAVGLLSSLWVRFIPHFGIDELLLQRIAPIRDEGGITELEGSPLLILPAHFLHSPGNFQVFDPVSKILYSGDLGASLGTREAEVIDFDQHVRFLEPFHTRYMASNQALRNWARMARSLDIDTIAPQHGAVLRGRPLVERFIAWCEQLQCGLDLLHEYRVPVKK